MVDLQNKSNLILKSWNGTIVLKSEVTSANHLNNLIYKYIFFFVIICDWSLVTISWTSFQHHPMHVDYFQSVITEPATIVNGITSLQYNTIYIYQWDYTRLNAERGVIVIQRNYTVLIIKSLEYLYLFYHDVAYYYYDNKETRDIFFNLDKNIHIYIFWYLFLIIIFWLILYFSYQCYFNEET